MESHGLQARVQSVASRIQSRLERLSAAVADQDPVQICIHTGRTALSIARLTTLGDTSRWGQLPIYMMRKAEWMIHNDLAHAAVHTMWINVGFRINDCLATPGVTEETQRLAQAWLRQTGWTGETILAARLQMASALFDHVMTMPD